MATAPHTTPYHSNRIREGRRLFSIPGGRTNRLDFILDQTIGHQSYHREQSEERGRRSSNRQVVPLTLCLYSQMSAGFFKGHFHPPATDKPTKNLQRRMIKIGRKQRLRIKLTQRIADQHPTDRGRHIPAAVPDGGLGVDFHFALLPAVPMIDLKLRPLRFRIVQYLLRRRAARAFHTWASILPGFSFGRRVVKLGVQTQPRDQIDSWRAADKIKQIQDGETAIANEDKISIRQPAGNQLNDLPGAIRQPLMPTPTLRVITLRWAQHCQEWQSPNTTRPRNVDQEHRAQPTEPTRLDEVGVRGANRVPVDSLGFDLMPAAAFDRVVDPDDQFAARRKGRDQNSQQHLSGLKRRPSRAIEHSMIVLKALVLTVARHAQTGGDSSFSDSENGPDQQGFRVFPDRFGEKRRELYNQGQQFGRQCWHQKDSFWRRCLSQLMRPAVTFSKIQIG